MIVPRWYSFSLVMRQWRPKHWPNYTFQRCSHIMDFQTRSYPIEILDSHPIWLYRFAKSQVSNRISVLPSTHKPMDNQNEPIRHWKLIYESSAMNNRLIGQSGFPWPNMQSMQTITHNKDPTLWITNWSYPKSTDHTTSRRNSIRRKNRTNTVTPQVITHSHITKPDDND